MTDQLAPFQCSTRAVSVDVVPSVPTAQQLETLGHDTPLSVGAISPPGVGLATTAQLVPFQCSTRNSSPEVVDAQPTAQQLVVVGHVTALRATQL